MGLIYYSTYDPVIHPVGGIPSPRCHSLDIRSKRLLEPYLTHTRLYYIHLLFITGFDASSRPSAPSACRLLKFFSSRREHLSKSLTSSQVKRVRLNNGVVPIRTDADGWMGWAKPTLGIQTKTEVALNLRVSEDRIGCGASTSFIVTQLSRLRSLVPRTLYFLSLGPNFISDGYRRHRLHIRYSHNEVLRTSWSASVACYYFSCCL